MWSNSRWTAVNFITGSRLCKSHSLTYFNYEAVLTINNDLVSLMPPISFLKNFWWLEFGFTIYCHLVGFWSHKIYNRAKFEPSHPEYQTTTNFKSWVIHTIILWFCHMLHTKCICIWRRHLKTVSGVQVTPLRIPKAGSVPHIYEVNCNPGNGQPAGNLTDSWFCPELEATQEGGNIEGQISATCTHVVLLVTWALFRWLQVQLNNTPDDFMQYPAVVVCVLVKADHAYRQSNLQADLKDWDAVSLKQS